MYDVKPLHCSNSYPYSPISLATMHTKTTLDTGLRIVTEQIPHARTAALGIWIDVGSRDETALNNGTSHFLEHMFFKGTRARTARQISMELDCFGGMSNAFTSKDTTCLYATVPGDKLTPLSHLLADVFTSSLFDQQEIEREAHVILQEIAMVEDMPDDQAYEQFEVDFWGGHALGQTVLGDADVVASMTSEKLATHIDTLYHPKNVVISCAGQVDHESFCASLEPLFAGFSRTAQPLSRREPDRSRALTHHVVRKDLEQVHLLLGAKGVKITSEKRFALILLNTLLGGNMSSRLFQEVREKRGLAYSIATFVESYEDCGYLGITGGVSKETVNEALDIIATQLQSVSNAASITDEEFRLALEYSKASLFLAGENLEARMTRNGRNEFYFGRDITLDEVAQAISKVTRDDIASLARELFGGPLGCLAMGAVTEKDVNWF